MNPHPTHIHPISPTCIFDMDGPNQIACTEKKREPKWFSWESHLVIRNSDPPEGVLRYFSLGLFKEPKWLFSHSVCMLSQFQS